MYANPWNNSDESVICQLQELQSDCRQEERWPAGQDCSHQDRPRHHAHQQQRARLRAPAPQAASGAWASCSVHLGTFSSSFPLLWPRPRPNRSKTCSSRALTATCCCSSWMVVVVVGARRGTAPTGTALTWTGNCLRSHGTTLHHTADRKDTALQWTTTEARNIPPRRPMEPKDTVLKWMATDARNIPTQQPMEPNDTALTWTVT